MNLIYRQWILRTVVTLIVYGLIYLGFWYFNFTSAWAWTLMITMLVYKTFLKKVM